jgi:hypothetical protein
MGGTPCLDLKTPPSCGWASQQNIKLFCWHNTIIHRRKPMSPAASVTIFTITVNASDTEKAWVVAADNPEDALAPIAHGIS